MWFYKSRFLVSRFHSPSGLCSLGSFLRHVHTTRPLAAGHSKWANIRHIKAEKDGQKSLMFSKFVRQIRLAVQDGGSADPAMNSVLRSVIDDALRKNMPMATIQSTLKKSSQTKLALKKHVLYLRFQQKVFMVCVIYTESFPQVKMEIAPILRKNGTVYVDSQHLFDDIGVIEATLAEDIKKQIKSPDEMEELCTEHAIDCGAEDVEVTNYSDGIVNFICNPIEISVVCRALKGKNYIIQNSEHIYVPKTTIGLTADDKAAYTKLLEKLLVVPGVECIHDNLQVDTN